MWCCTGMHWWDSKISIFSSNRSIEKSCSSKADGSWTRVIMFIVNIFRCFTIIRLLFLGNFRTMTWKVWSDVVDECRYSEISISTKFIMFDGGLYKWDDRRASHALKSEANSAPCFQNPLMNNNFAFGFDLAEMPSGVSKNFVIRAILAKSRHELMIGSSQKLLG